MSKIKLSEEQKIKIKKDFESISTVNDFCNLLNYCQEIIYNQKVVIITEKTLKFYSHPNSKSRYHSFEIKKKNGGVRTIHAPQSELKIILKCLNLILSAIYTSHKNAHGFTEKKSVVSNALQHSNHNFIFNLDLKDFFPSIEIGRILRRLNYPPFNLNSEERRKIALYIGWLSTINLDAGIQNNETSISNGKRVLPQGSPVSPVLTNIICERLDILLTAVASRFGAYYTRYADDISFSSQHFIYKKNGEFRKEIERVIKEQYFQINLGKVRLQGRRVRQEVTGITVNEAPNVNRKFVKTIRMWLYFLENYEPEKALDLFIKSYSANKGHIKRPIRTIAFLMAVLRGKLDFLKMVKKVDDPTYVKLQERFNIQYDKFLNNAGRSELSETNEIQISEEKNIVDLILELGIERALKNYMPNGV